MTTQTEQPKDTNTDPKADTNLSQEKPDTNTDQQPTDEGKATPQELKQREIVSAKQKLIDAGTINHSDLAPWLQEQTTPSEAKQKVDTETEMTNRIRKEVEEDIEYKALLKTIPTDTPKEKLQQMEDIMDDARYSTMSTPERLEFAKYKTGIAGNKTVEEARQEGIEIGKFGLLGVGNQNTEEKVVTEQDKINKKRISTLPKWAQK